MNYWSDENHKKWFRHYFGGFYESCYLAFTKEWADQNIPSSGKLHCRLLDTETNVVYEMPIHAAYEERTESCYSDDYMEEMVIKCQSLTRYFYEQHHCACHRHTDAVNAGLNENDEDFECEGNRFVIQAITPTGFPELILYSEIMTCDELEADLRERYEKSA